MALGLDDVEVGVFTHPDGHTGCTVVLPPAGAIGGMAVRGGAPGTRESAILTSTASGSACHAVLLTGCSLFGLRAADGVVDWCEARGRGIALPMGCFPIVGAAVVLDIARAGTARLDAAAGRFACEAASADEPACGAVGVGAGCSVGKEAGRAWSSPGGQGVAVVREGELVVGALLGVNPLGSVYAANGTLLAGCRAPPDAPRYPTRVWSSVEEAAHANTVIGCVATNARLDKAGACRVADLAHTGIARSVQPAHTSLDGDALFCLATGEVDASLDLVATLAARAVEDAVRAGVATSPSAAPPRR